VSGGRGCEPVATVADRVDYPTLHFPHPDGASMANAQVSGPPAAGPPGPGVPSARPARVPSRAALDETTLVVRAQDGDVGAFEELARRHQNALFRVAVRVLGDATDAEDALQDALVDAWRRIGTFRGEAAFSTWMYRIVTHRCTALVRRRRRTEPLPTDDGPGAPADDRSPTPERAAEVDAEMAAGGPAHGLGAAGAGGAGLQRDLADHRGG
jgi:RNA polymerase sigma-70 factor (ECF subfamily)